MHLTIARGLVCGILVLLTLSFTALPGTAAPRAAPADFTAIDRYVEQELQATRLPGLALGIVQGDQIVHLRGFGVADSKGRPVTPQTPFILASVSKSFTALAIMQLVEAGKVELDAPVQRYLPWFRVADAQASAQITVRHLLNQTSGLSTLTGNTYGLHKDLSDGALEQEARALRTVELANPVGEIQQYCNMNYSILGLIVQVVSGEPYERYVREHILNPLEMGESFASPSEAEQHGLATGYQFWFGQPVPSELSYNRAVVPAGYISSSAEDMVHYLIANLNGGRYGAAELLSPAGIAEMHGTAGGKSYAMGWHGEEINSVPVVMHAGDIDGFYASMILVPEGEWGIVLLINGLNYLQPRIQGIDDGVMSMLVGRQPPPVSNYDVQVLMLLVAALGACILQILGIARSIALLRRWRVQPVRRPRGAVGVARRVALPLVLNLLWALVCLVIVPQWAEVPLLRLVRVDVGLVIVVSGGIALVWGILRALFAFFVLRTPGAPIAVEAPAAAR
ncbi:MAG TPA: serine hydrolase domain-containing protein [Roseiflexaceae bacterium]|nr:serine hydrolase domain-containing protein [Roseiflexaceae bacterium]